MKFHSYIDTNGLGKGKKMIFYFCECSKKCFEYNEEIEPVIQQYEKDGGLIMRNKYNYVK